SPRGTRGSTGGPGMRRNGARDGGGSPRKREGRKAVVTGASRGIGRAIAIGLAQEGADVAVNYATREAQADDVVREIEKLGQRALAVRADVSHFPDTFRMAQEVLGAFGHVDILVNNAGISSDKTFVKMD